MTYLSIQEFFENLRKSNTVFSCTTVRKNDKKVDGVVVEPAGTEFRSVYRMGVPATKKPAGYRLAPGVRMAEDQKNAVFTAYDVMKYDKEGKRGAFRRINLAGVRQIKHKGMVYIPEFVDGEWKIKS